MTAPIQFRPHHFLCSLGYEGKGYSDDFTANMGAIVMGRLRAEDGNDCVIEVVEATDDICAPCPKRRGQLCIEQSKIGALDVAHAQALNLEPGDRLTWGDALERIKSTVQPDDLDQICAGCSWLGAGMCKGALSRLLSAPLRPATTSETPAT